MYGCGDPSGPAARQPRTRPSTVHRSSPHCYRRDLEPRGLRPQHPPPPCGVPDDLSIMVRVGARWCIFLTVLTVGLGAPNGLVGARTVKSQSTAVPVVVVSILGAWCMVRPGAPT